MLEENDFNESKSKYLSLLTIAGYCTFLENMVLNEHTNSFQSDLEKLKNNNRSILYQDKTFHIASYENRICIPQDIDCVLTTDQYETFINYLIENNYHYKESIYLNWNHYIPVVTSVTSSDCIQTYKKIHISYKSITKSKLLCALETILDKQTIKYISKNSSYISSFLQNTNTILTQKTDIVLDIFICKDSYTIIDVLNILCGENTDFYCNALRMIGTSISIHPKLIHTIENKYHFIFYNSYHLQKSFMTIFDQIEKKEANEIYITKCYNT